MLKLQLWFVRVILKTPTPSKKIKVEPSIPMVKDLLVDNIDGHVIYFCDEAAGIAKPDTIDKHRHVVGMLVVSIKIGDHCYHGLCDVGASVSAIPYALYKETMNDICSDQTSNGPISMLRCHPWISNADTTQYLKDL